MVCEGDLSEGRAAAGHVRMAAVNVSHQDDKAVGREVLVSGNGGEYRQHQAAKHQDEPTGEGKTSLTNSVPWQLN